MNPLRHLLTLALLLTAAAASAQVIPSGSKKLPQAGPVLAMLGSPMSKMFDTFGPPTDVAPQGNKTPYVQADYGEFSFSIRDKQIFESYVWSKLTGDSGLGFNFGDTLDDATKKLGKPSKTIVNKDGSGEADWNAADKNRTIEMIFNPKKTCIGFGVMKH